MLSGILLFFNAGLTCKMIIELVVQGEPGDLDYRMLQENRPSALLQMDNAKGCGTFLKCNRKKINWLCKKFEKIIEYIFLCSIE